MSNVLVATALADREAPVAFSPDGRRTVLSPDAPAGDTGHRRGAGRD